MDDPDRASPALLTDLYQLTMAYGYWKQDRLEQDAVFHLTFREHPFQSGYTVTCGLADVINYIRHFRFHPDDLAYLGELKGGDGKKLFGPGFLKYLSKLDFACDMEAIPEGSMVFPHEPLLRISGPLVQCQLLETALLNIINFQTLIATKAARICLAAHGAPVLEFGLRRAHGPDGALAATRAAYIGGCAATSNVLAGKVFGIPVRGTHAHSWVMSFSNEPEAFAAFAATFPGNSIFLVDTYDTLEGVRNAIEAGRVLRQKGHDLMGIRLDSGDLAYLSIQARRLLDEAGFKQTQILASNDLDENIISSLQSQGAVIDVWGVGTKLVTAFDQPALGGVFKLGAVRWPGGDWECKIKLSEQAVKVSNPGFLQVRRFEHQSGYVADMLYNELGGINTPQTIVNPADITMRKKIPAKSKHHDLLVPIFRKGELTYQSPPIQEIRAFAQKELKRFHSGIKRLLNPHIYPVGLELGLHELKTGMMEAFRPKPVAEEDEEGA
jgi:nicotinate phosphoribosyltransferase